MATQTFINLPVKDLNRTTEFFTKLGFAFDPQATDDSGTRMIISDDTSVILQVEPAFREYTQCDIPDTAKSREVIVGLTAESREQVDDLADRAVAAGGLSLGEGEDQGFMYMRGFRDLDGHQWSFLYMDMSAFSG